MNVDHKMENPAPHSIEDDKSGPLPHSDSCPATPSTCLLLWQYLDTPICLNHVDIPIIACCIVTGLLDASSFAAWQTFIRVQTGNAMLFGLSSSKSSGWSTPCTNL